MVAPPRRRREVNDAGATLRRHQILSREGQADRAPCPTLEGAMHRPGVSHEVRPSPGMAREEVKWEHIAFEAIARAAGRDEVARVVRPATGQRHHMIECGGALIETRRTVDAPLAAVTQGGAPHGLLGGHVRGDLGPK
jgi:hypothetical protein